MATQNIERRVERLELSLRIGGKPETLEDMFRAFERGEYGPGNMMSIVSYALSTPDRKGFFESLRKTMPDLLVDWFVEQIKRNADEKVNET